MTFWGFGTIERGGVKFRIMNMRVRPGRREPSFHARRRSVLYMEEEVVIYNVYSERCMIVWFVSGDSVFRTGAW